MTFDIWLFYVATVLALMSTPGPSQLLILSNSSVHGFKHASATICGDLTANMLQMLAAGLGLASLVLTSATALSVIKWVGVAYLIWLGLRMILKARVSDPSIEQDKTQASLKSLWLQGFLTSAANPKAVVFFAALFPQFISPDHDFLSQFLILSLTYIALDGVFLSVYGLSASWVRQKLQGQGQLWIDRIGGSFMILAAVLLGLKGLSKP